MLISSEPRISLLFNSLRRCLLAQLIAVFLGVISPSLFAQNETNTSIKLNAASPTEEPIITNGDGHAEKSNEDKRAASGIVVTLSGSVITAALAVLAGQVTFAAFAFDKGKYQSLSSLKKRVFAVLNLIAVCFLVGSIISGGRGIAILYKAGFVGHWELDSSGNNFEVQTDLCLLGLLCVIFVVAVGMSTSEPRSNSAEGQPPANELQHLKTRIHNMEKRMQSLTNAERNLNLIDAKVRSLMKGKKR